MSSLGFVALGVGASGIVVLGASFGALFLLFFFFATERRRPRRWPRARAVAGVVAVLALWLLVVRPASSRSVALRTAVLLTSGMAVDTLREVDRDLPVFHLAGLEPAAALRSTPISDLAQIARQQPEVNRLRVYGHGLRAWEWQRTDAAATLVAPASITAGMQQVSWPRSLSRGETLSVRGTVAVADGKAVAEKKVTLRLLGPGGVVDTVALAGEGVQPFVLQDRPRDEGRFRYELMLDDGENATGEIFEVEVTKPRPLAVLWLESAPRFETRHLKSWLAEAGSSLAVRSTISRSRYRDEYHNRPAVPLDRLTSELLGSFDLAVVDGPILVGLPPAAQEALTAAVFEAGLGLLLVPPLEPFVEGKARAESPFLAASPRLIEDLKTLAVRATWSGAELAPPLTVGAYTLVPRRGLDPLVRASGRVLAGRRSHGAGFVGVSLLHDTYRWVLEGHEQVHRAFWSHLASALARPEPAVSTCQLPSGPVLVDQPHALVISTSVPQPEARLVVGAGESFPLALDQDPIETLQWKTTIWPRHEGWHRVVLHDIAVQHDIGEDNAEMACSFYAQPAAHWQAWQQQQRLDDTRQRAVLGPAPSAAAPDLKRCQPWPRLGPFLAFLTAMGFLWVGERFGV